MTGYRVIRALLAGSALFILGLTGASAARQVVSITADGVNLRARPGMAGQVLWRLGSGYPLEVVGRKGSWLRVVDFENDKGWVARRFTGAGAHSIVKAPHANLRAGPGTGHRVLRSAEYGEVFRVIGRRKAWIRVQGDDARTGWIARRLLWGL